MREKGQGWRVGYGREGRDNEWKMVKVASVETVQLTYESRFHSVLIYL